ncbi:hypothetical protein pEaSNUABM54_00315 [Erwinia phage pEa_SNUABM_54]|nr:hypothetical protein pEaSNUABM54_00315 [Erwinia phage pEa_SNUABM_54]
MSANDLMLTVGSAVNGARDNFAMLRGVTVALENIRDEIETEGMSRSMAELIEQQVPGSVAQRPNAFTQYPSQVNYAAGMEALGVAGSKTLKGIILAIIGACVAAIGAFLGWIVKKYKGRDADALKRRAKDKRVQKTNPPERGQMRPEWRDDLEYAASVENFRASITVGLIETGAGKHGKMLNSIMFGRDGGLLAVLTKHIDSSMKSIVTTTKAMEGNPAVYDRHSGNPAVVAELKNLAEATMNQYLLLQRVQPEGIKGNGVLSDRVLELRARIEKEAQTPGLTADVDLNTLYNTRQVIDEAINNILDIDVTPMGRECTAAGKSLQQLMDRLDLTFRAGSSAATEALLDSIQSVQLMIDMQADLIGIINTIFASTIAADDNYTFMLRRQIEAMERVGIVPGSEFMTKDDQEFYRYAKEYLD